MYWGVVGDLSNGLTSAPPPPSGSCGPTSNGGYTYGQLLQVQNAAFTQNEGIITMWWTPDFIHDRWKYDGLNYRLSKVSFPPYNTDCGKNRRSDGCSTDITVRQGTAAGSCDSPTEVLFKIFSKNLESNTYGFDFLRSMQLTNEEVGIMLGQWAFNASLNGGGFLLVCHRQV